MNGSSSDRMWNENGGAKREMEGYSRQSKWHNTENVAAFVHYFCLPLHSILPHAPFIPFLFLSPEGTEAKYF